MNSTARTAEEESRKVVDVKVVRRSIKMDVFAEVICWALDVEKGRFDGS
jgi:hypothetical protein